MEISYKHALRDIKKIGNLIYSRLEALNREKKKKKKVLSGKVK